MQQGRRYIAASFHFRGAEKPGSYVIVVNISTFIIIIDTKQRRAVVMTILMTMMVMVIVYSIVYEYGSTRIILQTARKPMSLNPA